MSDSFEDRYIGVLHDLESAIVSVYRENLDLADSNVDRVLEGLIRTYNAEINQHTKPSLKLSSIDQLLFDRIRIVCEQHIEPRQGISISKEDINTVQKDAIEIIDCLKRIRLSIRRWTKRGGRQGYLSFINDFIK